MDIQENVALAPLTTFNIGGQARYFIEVDAADELGAAIDYAQTRKLPFFILAGGSNTLVADEGFDGVVIKINFSKYAIPATAGEKLYAEAGSVLSEVVLAACQQGFSGIESLYGIPGSVGGAVRGNAGAFGTEIGDRVVSVQALNIETRELKEFTNEECFFGYRTSFFKTNPEWIVVSVTLALEPSHTKECTAKAEETLSVRNERQIQNIQSAGSFFMNPRVSEDIQHMFEDEKGISAREGRVPAGWLIEKAGYKGVSRDGVTTGVRSANYVINEGSATAVAVAAFTSEIKAKVADMFNVVLQEEVTQVGF